MRDKLNQNYDMNVKQQKIRLRDYVHVSLVVHSQEFQASLRQRRKNVRDVADALERVLKVSERFPSHPSNIVSQWH